MAEEAASSLGMRPDVWKAMLAAAQAYERMGERELAQAKRRAAREVVEDIAASFMDQELKNAYRDETLKRLEDEQTAFHEFLERLCKAKDQSEFDQFMEDRARPKARPTNSDEDMPDGVPA